MNAATIKNAADFKILQHILDIQYHYYINFFYCFMNKICLIVKYELNNHALFVFFSQFSSDVLACNVDNNNMIEVLDTSNHAADKRANDVDTINDTSLFTSSFEDGQIKCE